MAADERSRFAPCLQALSVLLHYPQQDTVDNADAIADVLAARPEFPPEDRAELERFIQRLRTADLLHQQAGYVETFDRSKQVSLYLFEHVHGESRDRGPAMVELRMAYREQGLDIAANELPDYLPMFLEFCAQLPDADACGWLEDVSHILQEGHVRLHQRESRYALPFRLLLRLVDAEPWPEELVEDTKEEKRDDTREAIDSVWCEAPVTFEAGSALGGGCSGDSGTRTGKPAGYGTGQA
jgi:nitrate reductase delta subunit